MKRALFVAAAALMLAWGFRPEPVESHQVVNTTVNYDRDITRIMRKRCIACHSDNNLGLPLVAYEEVRPWAASIHEELLRRHMPPWRAINGYGDFVNDAGLTNKEMQFFLAWIDGNGPKSTEHLVVNVDLLKTAPADRLKLDTARWQFGKPELLKTLTPNMIQPGEGRMVRQVDIDLGLRSDRWIRAFEFKPGDRRVVRAATFTLRETGQWLGSWTPWYGVTTLPANTAFHVPAGSHIVADILYQAAEVPVQDAGSIGFYFAPNAVPSTPRDVVVEAAPMPNGSRVQGQTKFTGSVRLDSDTTLLALNPEMLEGSASLSVSARQPNGVVKVLLLINDALPEWPTPYVFKEPVRLTRGTELTLSHQIRTDGAPAAVKLTVSAVAQAPVNETR